MAEQSFDLILESLQNDILQVGNVLRQISETVISEGISEYPVFVASQEIIEIGKPIFDHAEIPLNWFFRASILEEFIQKKIVAGENLVRFKKTFGDPMEKACLFVVTPEEAKFVFVPYKEEEAIG